MEKLTTARGRLGQFGPLTLVLLFFALTSLLEAQTNEAIYLRFGNPSAIQGESTDAAHAGWIMITSYSDGLTAGPRPVGARPTPVVPPIRLRKPIDLATPRLLEAVRTRTPFPEAEIHFVRGAFIYMRILLSDVIVTESSFDTGQPPASREVLALDYNQIEMTHTKQLPDGTAGGTTSFTWSRVP